MSLQRRALLTRVGTDELLGACIGRAARFALRMAHKEERMIECLSIAIETLQVNHSLLKLVH